MIRQLGQARYYGNFFNIDSSEGAICLKGDHSTSIYLECSFTQHCLLQWVLHCIFARALLKAVAINFGSGYIYVEFIAM